MTPFVCLFRHPCSYTSKSEISLENLDESNLCRGISDATNPAVQENCNIICSLNEANVDPPEECSTQPSNTSQPIQYDTGSPNHNTMPCFGIKIELKLENGQTPVEVAHVVHDGVEKRKVLFSTEIELSNDHQQVIENNETVAASEWDDVISEDADDLLIFDSSTDSEGCRGQEEKFGNADANLSACSLKSVDAIDHCTTNVDQYSSSGNNREAIGAQGTDHTPQLLSGTFQNQVMLVNQNEETESSTAISIDCKVTILYVYLNFLR